MALIQDKGWDYFLNLYVNLTWQYKTLFSDKIKMVLWGIMYTSNFDQSSSRTISVEQGPASQFFWVKW